MNNINKIIDSALKAGVFGPNFTFRLNQRETIVQICEAYLEDPESTVILDAPTGTGKSIIAMWCSYIFKEMGNQGYLVTSDLMLQDQYENDFSRLKLKWPSVRGVDNYECHVNGNTFSLGVCKFKGMGYEAAEKQLKCFKHCGYLQSRKRAIEQPVSLLNYNYWLIQRNYVEDKLLQDNKEVPFKKRDFVFFDEAHKIDSIVQNHFAPRVDEDMINLFRSANKFSMRNGLGQSTVSESRIKTIIYDLMHEEDPNELMKAIADMRWLATVYRKVHQAGRVRCKKAFPGDSAVPKDWATFFVIMDKMKDIWCKFDDYHDIIKEHGVDSMVIDRDDKETKFMCVEESNMVKQFLLEKAGFKIFMSATLGDIRSFAKHMGIQSAKVIRLGNQFNYDKSPVIFVNRHKLSYRERERNLPKVVEVLDKILDKHKGQRGIIHTGSYAFTEYIKQHSQHGWRIMDYSGSKEKAEQLDIFKYKEGSILMGPSLIEGLDLKDDNSRFQIFFKVPYPSLGDPLVKAKMGKYVDWYDWKTGVSIMQGVGRSVRNEDDWAVTYILDACFNSLINKKGFFPDSFTERVKIIK